MRKVSRIRAKRPRIAVQGAEKSAMQARHPDRTDFQGETASGGRWRSGCNPFGQIIPMVFLTLRSGRCKPVSAACSAMGRARHLAGQGWNPLGNKAHSEVLLHPDSSIPHRTMGRGWMGVRKDGARTASLANKRVRRQAQQMCHPGEREFNKHDSQLQNPWFSLCRGQRASSVSDGKQTRPQPSGLTQPVFGLAHAASQRRSGTAAGKELAGSLGQL